MTKYLNCLKAVALAFIFGLLAACAHPDSVNLGTSYDSVMDKLELRIQEQFCRTGLFDWFTLCSQWVSSPTS